MRRSVRFVLFSLHLALFLVLTRFAFADHNYKLIWTPSWIAWYIDDVLFRNETKDTRPDTVPWYVTLVCLFIHRLHSHLSLLSIAGVR
jgi:hypothetical protein